jgi:macrolide transport system ATP-binding/permease protein
MEIASAIADVRHAWRSTRRMPIVSTVVVVSLAIGIGVNTAVFSWMDAVVLRPLAGVPDAGGFQTVEPRAETGSYPGVSWLEYQDLRAQLRSFRDLLAFRMAPFNVGEIGRVERAYGLFVSGNYFSALELTPALGRFIRPDDAIRPGAEPIVVISHQYWRTRLAGDARALGRTLRVNDRLLTIVGVAPPKFQGTVLGLNFDLWIPATLAGPLLAGSRELEDRSLRGYIAMGRLQPHVSHGQAQAELDETMRQLARTYPQDNANMTADVLPFWQAPRGPQRMFARALMTLQAILLVLLLAVCGNTANLLLARASARQREIGMRLALGATPWRVLRLLLTESMLLAIGGVAFGAAIGAWATDALRAVPMISGFPIRLQTSLNGLSLTFAILLGLACGFVFGLAPALQLARVDPQTAIRSGARTAGRSRLRHTLMAVEVALAAMVLMAAGLFYRNFADAHDIDPGFRRDGVLLAAYDLSPRNPDDGAVREFPARLLDRVRALPSVDAAAIASAVPLDIHGLPLRTFTIEGRAQNPDAPDRALSNVVTPDYFRTMDIPLRAGRDFADLRAAAAPPQAIVNDEFVRRFVDGGDPRAALGRRLQTRGRTYAITGVVRNSISESFGEPPTPVVYFSYRDRPAFQGELHVRTRAGAETLLAPQVERIVHELDPALPVYNVRTLGDHIERNLFLSRIPARIFVVLGPLLLALAAIGIYAVVSYTVSHRTSEIGIRMMLGATGQRVVSQIVGESLCVVTAGAMSGWFVAVMVALHLVRGPMYPSVFAGVPLVLLLVAAIACWLPARRAAALDPIAALREA